MRNAASESHVDPTRSNRQQNASEEVTLEENVNEIKAWELATLHSRLRVEQLSDWIAAKAASAPALLGHVVWFVAWIAINTGWIPGITPFDRFPFPFLTLTVYLEAISSRSLFSPARTGWRVRRIGEATSICKSIYLPNAR